MCDDYEEDLKISRYAAQRRMQQKKMERKVRQSQMWLKRFRAIFRLCLVLALIFLGYSLLRLPQWYMNKDAFNNSSNTSLEILNNKIVPSYKILAALRRNKVPTVPIYLADTDDIKKSIMQLEPVEDVFIRRFWFPARLQVIIQERIPVVTISPDEKVAPIAFFAKGGKLIGRDYMPLHKSFKTIKVLSYGIRGDDYRKWDNNKIKLIENIAKAVEVNAKEPIEYIDFRNPNDVYVKVKTAKIRLGKVDEDVFERIKRIPSILPEVKTLNKKIKYLDLRWEDANYIKLEE